jgi:hypothetical protein
MLRVVKPLAARRGAVPLCALAAHALLYRSFAPRDGAHAYLGWYEPAVAALSLLSLGALAALLAVPALRRRAAPLLARERAPLPGRCARLATSSFAFLLVQECAEHIATEGRLQVPLQRPSTLALALLCAAAAAVALTLVERLVAVVATRALAPARRALPTPQPAPRPHGHEPARPRPLAAHRALRAPPPLAA